MIISFVEWTKQLIKLRFSHYIFNFILLGVLVGLSFITVSFFGVLGIASNYELITGTNFDEVTPMLILLISSLLGVYISILQIWKHNENRVNYQFAIVYAVFLMIASGSMIFCMADAAQFAKDNLAGINFPNDVDELTAEIKISLINSASLIFKLILAIGTITLGGVFFIIKRSFKVEN